MNETTIEGKMEKDERMKEEKGNSREGGYFFGGVSMQASSRKKSTSGSRETKQEKSGNTTPEQQRQQREGKQATGKQIQTHSNQAQEANWTERKPTTTTTKEKNNNKDKHKMTTTDEQKRKTRHPLHKPTQFLLPTPKIGTSTSNENIKKLKNKPEPYTLPKNPKKNTNNKT